jgi:hypothetical protein
VLKPGGHFSISDIVLLGELTFDLQREAELYVGCIAGAMQRDAYLQVIREAGFKNVTVQKEHRIELPAEFLARFGAANAGLEAQAAVLSITVTGTKP